ncbi:DUF3159 domain-containing protein [Pseudolysinimonas kribbensis]|uniref:DUF3159 domain-containing protein n=1 Tax=Pseudolysinimonas kribbensis TaxID=433641 RepID=A0ABQ6KER1_9MICO|nr:DUF3159 domain-containing protein [Pseudolysinimonas kribbensis]GMA96887.1 hypothetical protein GCM10025881_37110 [Pseudolysinimonas kribbensis]
MTTPDPQRPEGDAPDVHDALGQALRRSSLGRIAPGETPSARTLLQAMGGVLGIVESILPTLLFLIVYTVTGSFLSPTDRLVWAVAAPAVVAIAFIVVRVVRRQAVMTAIVGFLGIAVSGGLAFFTNNINNNFLLGFGIDGAIVVIMALSLVVRRPFLGVLVGFLIGDRTWREDAAQRRVALVATVLWLFLGAIRLIVEVPLFLLDQTTALATMKLILGVPLYAVILWLTWLLFRTAWTMPERDDGESSEDDVER